MKKALLDRLRRLDGRQLYDELYRDPLTQCLNRRAYELIEEQPVAIIDLDSLKYINDADGHRYGDALIVRLACLLTTHFGSEYVYRLSGDEFLVSSPKAVLLHVALKSLQVEHRYFSFGVGTNLQQADKRLLQNKADRECLNFRARRGECPPWYQSLLGEFQCKFNSSL